MPVRVRQLHQPPLRVREDEAVTRALAGEAVELAQRLTNADRCVGVAAAGQIARRCGDAGLALGHLTLRHTGAAGHFYAAYCVRGMEFRMQGVVADSCFTAAYGGKLVLVPEAAFPEAAAPTLVGNTFAYGARGGRAYVAGRGGNRFGICLRRNHEGGAARIVVEGVEANAFQGMTGGLALVLGPTGFNLGSGMTGGVVYLLDPDERQLNAQYVQLDGLRPDEASLVRELLEEHLAETRSPRAAGLLERFEPRRFGRVTTRLKPEATE